MALTEIRLVLDEADAATVEAEFADRKRPERMEAMPDGESNDDGAIVAEIIRDLNEYRAMYDASRESKESPDADAAG